MCLRKLSEAVYSHNSFQASSRVGMRLSPHGAVSVAWEAVGNEAGRWRQAWSYTDLSGCIPDQFSTTAEVGDSGRISREFAPAGEMPSGDSICRLHPEQLVKKERGKNPFRPPLWKS